ncbi:MAG: class I SAM-dependent methyltransferase [Cardiobacteriaceae bacterium]|nr:class I SAM-dependent methyltransferase [Cardiobacteriaceae bacterium]
MSEKIALDITTVSETLLIPLWAKAVEQKESVPLLVDHEAPRMMAMIDYDFNKFANAKLSQAGCSGRAQLFDREAQAFIASHPDAVVVQLGAGLDARYERLGRPAVTAWYDLDLPEVIELRKQLLPASHNHYLGCSLFDEDWMTRIAACNKPTLLLCEGVLMYFDIADVKALFATLARHLPQATLVFDIIPTILVGKAKQHDSLRTMGKTPPEFKWSLKDSRELEQWLPGLQRQHESLLSKTCGRRYPWFFRAILRCIGPRFDQRIVRVRLP